MSASLNREGDGASSASRSTRPGEPSLVKPDFIGNANVSCRIEEEGEVITHSGAVNGVDLKQAVIVAVNCEMIAA